RNGEASNSRTVREEVNRITGQISRFSVCRAAEVVQCRCTPLQRRGCASSPVKCRMEAPGHRAERSRSVFMTHRHCVMAATLGIVTSWAIAAGAQRPQTNLPLDPPRERGSSITPAYEGWYPNPDGRFSMLIGYYH